MIRPRKVAAIARFEFTNVAKRWSYLLVTFGLPLFFSALSGGLLTIQGKFLVERAERTTVYGLVDHEGLLGSDAIWSDFDGVEGSRARHAILEAELPMQDARFLVLDAVVFMRFASDDEALAQLRVQHLGAVYAVSGDYLQSGKVTVYESESGPVISVRSATVEPVLERLLTERLLRGHVGEEVIARALDPMRLDRVTMAPNGDQRSTENRALELVVRTGVPFLLGVLLLTALLSASGYLVQTVALDKESKVVEVLLSSADPDELLTGKLLGLGGAGLLQFFVWAAMVVGGALTLAAVVASLEVPVPWAAIAISPLFFVLGYLFIGSLMLCTGSLGSSVPESQKLTLGWAMLAVLPLMLMVILLEEPHGTVGRVLTWIPFSAPLTVIVRMSIAPEGIAFHEILGALGVLLASTWLAIRFGARLFRVGLLLTGSRPSVRELLRQARLLD
ncbi:MAG: ABC transporter permease [Sandaracinus sp.]|nr:ABC transporter permease [Sandaracinus sp.]MCB9623189.1 ABC transporter permease [Sandaracinus sp.]